jgi:Tfp pilus assembly protein PilF
LQPNYLEAHLNLGLAYSESGQEREARQQFARAAILESRPGGLALGSLRGIPLGVRNRLTSMHVELGDLYLDHGAAAEAAREYHRALRFSPTYPDVRLKLARAHVEMGRTAEALRILESVREHNPTYTEARILLGSLYQICREPGKAREEFEECRRLNPADPRPAVYLRLLDRS